MSKDEKFQKSVVQLLSAISEWGESVTEEQKLEAEKKAPPLITVPDPSMFEKNDKITWSVSSEKPYPRLSITPFKEWVYELWEELKSEYGRNEGFDQLLEVLKEKGINIEGFPDYDMKKFDATYRQINRRESKKKLNK